ncbi:hypothetical protein SASPL_141054 [Salvia splendens]|uniref:Uncharacterized protein n=1 Tax=Salvia splendens TaxID=180675 RepID=A0A8X8WSV9_SALSN|nr:hypothetical protein SASPL_141054 [Salvia splendens]
MAGRYDQNPFAVYWWFPFLLICLSLDELAESFLWGSILFVRYESEDLCWENMQNPSNERSIGIVFESTAIVEEVLTGKEKTNGGNTVMRLQGMV